MDQVQWLLGREGGIGFVPVPSGGPSGYLLMVLGDEEGNVTPGLSFLLGPRARRCLLGLLSRFEESGSVVDPSATLNPRLWGEGPKPTL